MMKPLLLLSTALTLFSCTSRSTMFDDSGLLIAERKADGGGRIEYRLYPGRDSNNARLDKTVSTPYERAKLDSVSVEDLNANLAQRLGATPWNGVYVSSVGSSSNAAKAGLMAEDVILDVAGAPVTNARQFDETVAARLAPSSPLDFRVRRGSGTAATELHVSVLPDIVRGRESHTDAFNLETSSGVQSLTGIQVANVPADLAREAFDRDAPFTVVSGVISGSPAYLEGFRRGDRVLTFDGEQNPQLPAVRKAVFSRARASSLPQTAMESLDGISFDSASGDIPADVTGPLGNHHGEVEVDEDLLSNAEFEFPILFDYSSSVSRLDWSFLDVIFQFGATYHREYLPSSTRSARYESKLSMLPFGMFEFETTPTSSKTTLFWFIHWESTR